mgnify:CR=1 FL=1
MRALRTLPKEVLIREMQCATGKRSEAAAMVRRVHGRVPVLVFTANQFLCAVG